VPDHLIQLAHGHLVGRGGGVDLEEDVAHSDYSVDTSFGIGVRIGNTIRFKKIEITFGKGKYLKICLNSAKQKNTKSNLN
jgi:hypothetical protein